MSANANSGATSEPTPKRQRTATAIDVSADDSDFRASVAVKLADLGDANATLRATVDKLSATVAQLVERLDALSRGNTATDVPMAQALAPEDGAGAGAGAGAGLNSNDDTPAPQHGTLSFCMSDLVDDGVPDDMPSEANMEYAITGPDCIEDTPHMFTVDGNPCLNCWVKDILEKVYMAILDNDDATDILQSQTGGRFDEDNEAAGEPNGTITLRVDFESVRENDGNFPFVATIKFD